MNIESLRDLCLNFPGAKEEIKWKTDLCFMVADKIFCTANLNAEDAGASFKVLPEEFDELIHRSGIIPAPYTGKNKWVQVNSWSCLTDKEWEFYVDQSYNIIKSKLPKYIQRQIH